VLRGGSFKNNATNVRSSNRNNNQPDNQNNNAGFRAMNPTYDGQSDTNQNRLNRKLQIVGQLLEVAQRAFVYKLTRQHPEMTESEVLAAIKNWYATRPGAELGDGVGVPGDPKRFDR
jgi:hypothetical protein